MRILPVNVNGLVLKYNFFQISGRDRNQKPPFLVVPLDQSGLMCIIQIDDESARSKLVENHSFRCNKHLNAKVKPFTILDLAALGQCD